MSSDLQATIYMSKFMRLVIDSLSNFAVRKLFFHFRCRLAKAATPVQASTPLLKVLATVSHPGHSSGCAPLKSCLTSRVRISISTYLPSSPSLYAQDHAGISSYSIPSKNPSLNLSALYRTTAHSPGNPETLPP